MTSTQKRIKKLQAEVNKLLEKYAAEVSNCTYTGDNERLFNKFGWAYVDVERNEVLICTDAPKELQGGVIIKYLFAGAIFKETTADYCRNAHYKQFAFA